MFSVIGLASSAVVLAPISAISSPKLLLRPTTNYANFVVTKKASPFTPHNFSTVARKQSVVKKLNSDLDKKGAMHKLCLEIYGGEAKSRSRISSREVISWLRPARKNKRLIRKLNCDATFHDDGSVGYGFVIRDNDAGEVVLAGAKRSMREGSSSTEIAKGLALIFALKTCIEAGVTEVRVESDCRNLIDGLQGCAGCIHGRQGDWIRNDIISLARAVDCLSFRHISCHENMLARGLANYVQETDMEFVWVDQLPRELEFLVASDADSYFCWK